MKERIKQIRKHYKVTQQEFAEKIGVSRTFVSQVEADMNIFSDRTLKDICRIFHINEEWLKTGNGEMLSPRTKNQQIAEFLNEVMEEKDESFKKQFVNSLASLDFDDWLKIEEILKKITKNAKMD